MKEIQMEDNRKINKKQENLYKKKVRTFSFAYEDGYMALDFLDEISKSVVGGKSGYLVSLILQDMERRQRNIGE